MIRYDFKASGLEILRSMRYRNSDGHMTFSNGLHGPASEDTTYALIYLQEVGKLCFCKESLISSNGIASDIMDDALGMVDYSTPEKVSFWIRIKLISGFDFELTNMDINTEGALSTESMVGNSMGQVTVDTGVFDFTEVWQLEVVKITLSETQAELTTANADLTAANASIVVKDDLIASNTTTIANLTAEVDDYAAKFTGVPALIDSIYGLCQ